MPRRKRQHLLQRTRLGVPQLLEHLVGLQAQAPQPPYYGLWSRLQDFRHEALSALWALLFAGVLAVLVLREQGAPVALPAPLAL